MTTLINKHSSIQENYKKLSLDRKNFASSELEKDKLIDHFTSKQIQEYEDKVQQENKYRKELKLKMLRDMQQANVQQIKRSLMKKMHQKRRQQDNEKLMIMKDIASKCVEEDDELERSRLKKQYLKQNLDIQNTHNLIQKRENFVLNRKELSMNQPIIQQMSKSKQESKGDIQEDLIQKSYMKSYL